MTSQQIGEKLGGLIRTERKITNEILEVINLALERRTYLDLGFPSMFEWLTKGFGYSHSAAFRRIESARMICAVPEVSAKLESGEVNLSTVGKAQTIIKAQEKATGRKISAVQKAEAIKKIEGQTFDECQQTLLTLFPEAASVVTQERRVVIDENMTRHSMNLPNEVEADLQRVKEVLSHQFPNGSDAEVIGYALKFLLDHVDPLRKKVTHKAADSASKRVSSKPDSRVPMSAQSSRPIHNLSLAGVRRTTIQSSDGKCSFRDPITGRVCGSKHQVQIDHIIPKVLGGSDDPENLRLLCQPHNIHAAEKVLEKEFMRRFRKV